jgi:hypothetical protein
MGDPLARRHALIGLAVGASIVGGLALAVAASRGGSSSSGGAAVTKGSLEAQKEFGWNVGADSTDLTFDGSTGEPFTPAQLDAMPSALGPASVALLPFYVPTLFQSLQPQTAGIGDAGTAIKPLRDVIKPIMTADMKRSFQQGRALSSLFEGAPSGRAVMVDLPGPLAVAFAAGLSDRLDVVFAFDGWPHPLGVVPSHQTLGAALQYQPLLTKAKADRPRSSPPAFVLDRGRLLPYADESTAFDNRYLAKVPAAEQLRGLGITQLLYVSLDNDKEADDLNDDFVAYEKVGIELRHISPVDFGPPTVETGAIAGGTAAKPDAGSTAGSGSSGSYDDRYYYGAHPTRHWYFWSFYGWGTPRYAYRPFTGVALRPVYHPYTRPTSFSGAGLGMRKTSPGTFGVVGVVKGPSGGTTTTRSGSWSRSSGYSSG